MVYGGGGLSCILLGGGVQPASFWSRVVVMLFCPLMVFHHFCLFESFLVVASKAKKGCDV